MIKVKIGIFKKNSDKLFNEEIVRMFKAEIANFFDRKSYFDFKNFDLPRLELGFLSKKSNNINF